MSEHHLPPRFDSRSPSRAKVEGLPDEYSGFATLTHSTPLRVTVSAVEAVSEAEWVAEERRARVLKSQISNGALPLSARARLRVRFDEIVFWLIVAATLAGCVEIVVRFF